MQQSAPEPTSTPTPELATQAFDGDCDSIFSTDDLTRILGTEMAAGTAYVATSALLTPVYVLGGTMCLWEGADENAYLEIAVLPGDEAGDEPYCYGIDGDARCSFTTAASDLELSAVVYGAKGMTTSALDDGIVELKSFFADAAATTTPVAPFVRPTDAWPATIECATLDASADLATALDTPKLYVSDGNGGAEMPPGVYDAEAEIGETSCLWQLDEFPAPDGQVGGLDVTFLPASAQVRSAVKGLEGASSLELAGTDGAVRVVHTDNGVDLDYTWVFSGSNALIISGRATEQQLMTAATALIDALS